MNTPALKPAARAAAGRGYLQALLAGELKPPSTAPALGWLKALRAEAVERVGALKLPTSRDEAWRFTDISALARQSFQPLHEATRLSPDAVAPFMIAEAATRLVFVDGVHAPELSCAPRDAGGVFVGNLAAAGAHDAVLQAHLGRHDAFREQLFSALNTAFLHDAAIVVLSRDTAAATPLHLLFVATQPDVASHPRVLIVAEPGSKATVIEDHVALHEGAYFSNAVAEVGVGANATVEHIRVQRESLAAFHIASCAVALGHAASYHSVSVALGAKISRLALDILQTAEDTHCTLDGLALIGERQLADTHSTIDHAKPHGTSRQLHKCIVGGAAHAVFNGQITVRPGAQQTDSAQSSRNLLLSPRALVDTQPQLEIFADDVKCTHGATVGQLDSDEVFYLQTRGLSEEVARKLLTYAFGAEIIDRIPVESLRLKLEQHVLEQTESRR